MPTKRTEEKKPTIPMDELQEFLESMIPLKDVAQIRRVEPCFLWDKYFRVNVWMDQEGSPDRVYIAKYIKYSYFMSYDKELGLVDLTITKEEE